MMQQATLAGIGVATPPPATTGEPAARPAPAPAGPAPGQRRRARLVLGAAALAVAAVGTWLAVRGGGPAGTTLQATGTVEATEAVLGFAAAGRIAEIRVHEGDVVSANAVLAVLDTAELMARLRQARAQLAVTTAQLADLESGARPQEVEDRRQAVSAAQRTLDQAELDLSRMRELALNEIASRQSLDAAQTARDVAATRLEQARQALTLTESGYRPGQIAAARAARAVASAQVGTLEASVPDYFVRSPFAGLVTVRAREPGESVTPGVPVVTLLNMDDRWVRIYVPENRVGAARIAQRATITVDAFPGQHFAGRVTWISEEAEFTPRNIQTQDERVNLVYAVKVQIVGDSAMALKPGMPADVHLALGAP